MGEPAGTPEKVSKVVDIVAKGEDQQMVYGWAYVCEEFGQTVLDHSGEFMDVDTLEKMAFDCMVESRDLGVMHKQTGAGQLVHSICTTPDIRKALNIQDDRVGWFIGAHISDAAAWDGVKKGDYTAFSIDGLGIREAVDVVG